MSACLPRRLRNATRDGDRGAAMLTALMLIMVVGTLSILVMGSLVSQVRPTSLVQKTSRTVFAAETGTQVALGELRTTLAAPDTNGDVYGDPSKLPCSLSGAVGEVSAQITYAVTVQYFESDPAGLTADGRTAAAMTCGTGGGGKGVTKAPAYAIISAKGLAAGVPGLATTTGDRSVETQYAFQQTNKNVPGGLFRTSDLAFCLRAESATQGSLVTYRGGCESARSALNLWVHTSQSYIALASTLTTQTPLCLDGPTSSGDERVRLAPCAVVGRQLFSYKPFFRYMRQNAANTAPGDVCLWAGTTSSALEGVAVRISSGGCAGGDKDVIRPFWSWNPEAGVGAGSASKASSGQIINYAEFGRCLEVTHENVNYDRMGIGPCKQTLPGNGNTWNQVWTRTEPSTGSGKTRLRIAPPRDPYDVRCLTTPAQGATAPAYPTLVYCSDARADQVWTRTVQTSSYGTSYLYVDRYNRCLGGGPVYYPDPTPLTSVVVEPCTGALDQKWNAPPNTTPPGQSNTNEG